MRTPSALELCVGGNREISSKVNLMDISHTLLVVHAIGYHLSGGFNLRDDWTTLGNNFSKSHNLGY